MAGILKVDKYQDFNGNDIMTSDGSGNLTLNNDAMKATPSFYATRTGGSQSMSDNTFTKAQINTELYDTDSCYDNSTNYRFTPTVAGKYYIFSCGVISDGGTQYENNLKIYKNGSALPEQQYNYQSSGGNLSTHFLAVVCDMNGSSDYVEVFMKGDSNGSTPNIGNGSSFGAYKIIGA
jgi:hypothetical protein